MATRKTICSPCHQPSRIARQTYFRGRSVQRARSGHDISIEVPQRVSARSASIPLGNDEMVLLVEDDDDVRSFVTSALARLAYRVFEASDATAALAILNKHPEIVVLFIDVGLPGVNGRQLGEEARQHVPDLKVLYTTGYAGKVIV